MIEVFFFVSPREKKTQKFFPSDFRLFSSQKFRSAEFFFFSSGKKSRKKTFRFARIFLFFELNFLRNFAWLNSAEPIEFVLSRFEVKHFSIDEQIYELDDEPGAVFFLVSGFVRIVSADGFEQIFGSPHFFGQRDLLNRTKRTETARSITNSLVDRFPGP